MEKYEIADQTFAVLDGQLWQLVTPVSGQQAIDEALPAKSVVKMKSANKLSERQIRQMVEDRLNEMSLSQVCEKYGVSAPTVSYWMKKQDAAVPANKKVKDYTCRDCRRSFKSNLSLLDVKCPNCNSLEIDDGASEPAIKEQ